MPVSLHLHSAFWLAIALYTNGHLGQAAPGSLDQQLLKTSVYDDITPIKSLLARGAHINAHDANGNTLLSTAARDGTLEIANFLLQHGADVNTKDNDNHTPLAIAARYNSLAMVDLLIGHGANVSAGLKTNTTPLSEALITQNRSDRKGFVGKIQTLIDHGADIQAGGSLGRTPVWYVSQSDADDDILKVLLDHGARPNVKDANGESALTHAQAGASKLLLDHGADITTSNNEGTTPLMEAAEFGDQAKIRLLLARGAKPNVTDNKGKTALAYAKSSSMIGPAKKRQTIQLLLSRKAH